jgi:hypothetical protein
MPLQIAPFSVCIPRLEQPRLEQHNERKKESDHKDARTNEQPRLEQHNARKEESNHKDARINDLGRAIENDFASIRDKYGIFIAIERSWNVLTLYSNAQASYRFSAWSAWI